MDSRQIRQQFLDFFASKDHAIVESSPVVPLDDPTLMFTNAGMNQFKDVFLGTGTRSYRRAANTQKCIRAGGKHNDLDDVGQDTYHHTFFEMLGNWSFGDYFKKEAIAWAWELLTNVWGIDKGRLHATYFGGLPSASREPANREPDSGGPAGREAASRGLQSARTARESTTAWELEPDLEARDLWLSVTDIDPAHVHPGGMKDNFWEMGDTGPCGPCSEIHIDLTPDKSGAALVNAGDPRVIELWNLVFIQFNRGADGALSPLPARHVDTGMGFERLCAVLQGMERGRLGQLSNYDTDVFTPIFAAIQRRTGAPDYCGTLPSEPPTSVGADSPELRDQGNREQGSREHAGSEQETQQQTLVRRSNPSVPQSLNPSIPVFVDVSYRVIADHLRCLVFALTDGAVPSNEGRGYVLRRILRRAVRYGRQYFNVHEPFLCDLVPDLVDHMAGVFPDLRNAHGGRNVNHVADIIRDEEASFLRTLERGIRLANAVFAGCKKLVGSRLPTDLRRNVLAAMQKAFAEASSVVAVTIGDRSELSSPSEVYDEIQATGSSGKLFDNIYEELRADPGSVPGRVAFVLHDTYGFPVDLIELMAWEQGLTVDVGAYERLMGQARALARAANSIRELVFADEPRGFGPTRFVGYEQLEPPEVIVRAVYRSADSVLSETGALGEGQRGAIVLDRTPFYAEQGGQVGDRGVIRCEQDAWSFSVHDTKKHGDTYLHFGECQAGTIRPRTRPPVGARRPGERLPSYPEDRVIAEARAAVDSKVRCATMQNHTSTHLLNWALREVLCPPEERVNPHVQQKGSLVDSEKTRFDFSHNKPLTAEEIERIEALCNERIAAGLPVYAATREEDFVDQKQARQINTLRAVFGEKYPDRVRVVSIGVPITEEDARRARESARASSRGSPGAGSTARAEARGSPDSAVETDWLLRDPKNPRWMQYSVEFCGGTHVRNTKEIERFVLVSEEGVAKGVRRVVGISGEAARRAVELGEALLHKAHELHANRGLQSVASFQQRLSEATIPLLVRMSIADLLGEVQKAQRQLAKQADSTAGDAVMDRVAALLTGAPRIADVAVVVGDVPSAPTDALRGAIDWIRNKTTASAVLLATESDGKVVLIAGMSKVVVERGLKAGELIQTVAPLVGGKGGGRPDMAQGGGTDPSGLPAALDTARRWIADRLNR